MEKAFFFLYSFLSLFLYILALPFLWLLSFKTKYQTSAPARFFLKNNPPLQKDGIWLHSCSFGEANAIRPLIENLPLSVLRLSTTTQTGYSVIKKYSEESRYLPFEPLLFGWLKPQKALVVMEAEFWYLMFALAKKRGAKTLLINARMSDRSFPAYFRMRWFYRKIFAYIDEVYAQTPTDKERLELLGAKNVRVTGNIKLAALPSPTKKLEKPSGLLVCAASTHEGEEELAVEAFLKLRKENSSAKFAIVPRHPERFGKVAQMVNETAQKEGLSWHRYSQNEHLDSDIVVVDMLGELINIYPVSDIVILGGSFVPVGGHNAAEAAQFGCKIISGKHYFNQKDIFAAIEGIAVVEDSNLSRRLLQHALLAPTRIKNKSDISPILESINDVLHH